MSSPMPKTGGIRARLDRLTKPELKKFVSDAVAAEKKQPNSKGAKALKDLNKYWAESLKRLKQHDELLVAAQDAVSATSKATSLDDPAWARAEKLLYESRKRLAVINADLTKFEQSELAVQAAYKL